MDTLRQARSVATGPGRWGRVVVLAAVLAGGGLVAWALGLGSLFHLERLAQLTQWLEGCGAWGPVIYIIGYVGLELVFVPALPITILGGVAFGPVWGTVYVSVAATLSAALAFLLARYAVRDLVERWVVQSPRLSQIDAAVEEHGWRILIVTRLVPLFPYNLQNFAYGLTRIRFWPYVLLTWVCLLPATVALTLAGSALARGSGDVRRTLVYLGIAGVVLVAVSLLPRWMARRSPVTGELLGRK